MATIPCCFTLSPAKHQHTKSFRFNMKLCVGFSFKSESQRPHSQKKIARSVAHFFLYLFPSEKKILRVCVLLLLRMKHLVFMVRLYHAVGAGSVLPHTHKITFDKFPGCTIHTSTLIHFAFSGEWKNYLGSMHSVDRIISNRVEKHANSSVARSRPTLRPLLWPSQN